MLLITNFFLQNYIFTNFGLTNDGDNGGEFQLTASDSSTYSIFIRQPAFNNITMAVIGGAFYIINRGETSFHFC
jgi:hypothetical protein